MGLGLQVSRFVTAQPIIKPGFANSKAACRATGGGRHERALWVSPRSVFYFYIGSLERVPTDSFWQFFIFGLWPEPDNEDADEIDRGHD